ncbi:MAG: type II secretion system protein [Sedimentisphaerales bacterium]|nr:type II secretion system protein [Sedimentisphaerales bacterium]
MMYGGTVPKPVGHRDGPRRLKHQATSAFTLIELLVVISIVALLMAILLPALQRVKKQAGAVLSRANLNQWGTIMFLYTEDYQGRLPANWIPAVWLLRGSYLQDGDPNRPPMYHDFNTKGIACCPMAVRVRSANPGLGTASGSSDLDNTSWSIRYMSGSTFEAWEIISPTPPFRGSYGLNEDLLEIFNMPGYLRHRFRGIDTYSINNKNNVPVLLDCKRWHGSHESFGGRPPPFEDSFMKPFCINRHSGHVNGLFLDFSARKVGLKELWILKWHSEYDTANVWTRAGGVQPEDWPEWMRNFRDY